MSRSLRSAAATPARGFLFVLAVCACTPSVRRVEFQGLAADPKVLPAAVVEAPALPRGAERLGRLSVRCEPVDPGESFSDRSLVDVDCSEERLKALLREAAAERGGDVLAEARCERSGGVRCRATLARLPDEAPPLGQSETAKASAPAAAVSVEKSPAIRVSFAAKSPGFRRPARELAAVRELASPSPIAIAVGELATSCEGCREPELREALLISAGRLGIADVVGVRCIAGLETARCEAEAMAPELEHDPSPAP